MHTENSTLESADTEKIDTMHRSKEGSSESRPRLGTSTLSVHGGEAKKKPSDAITDSIVCSSTYTFDNTEEIIGFLETGVQREEYGRYGNPNERVVEKKLAALEGAEEAIVFSIRRRWSIL